MFDQLARSGVVVGCIRYDNLPFLECSSQSTSRPSMFSSVLWLRPFAGAVADIAESEGVTLFSNVESRSRRKGLSACLTWRLRGVSDDEEKRAESPIAGGIEKSLHHIIREEFWWSKLYDRSRHFLGPCDPWDRNQSKHPLSWP